MSMIWHHDYSLDKYIQLPIYNVWMDQPLSFGHYMTRIMKFPLVACQDFKPYHELI